MLLQMLKQSSCRVKQKAVTGASLKDCWLQPQTSCVDVNSLLKSPLVCCHLAAADAAAAVLPLALADAAAEAEAAALEAAAAEADAPTAAAPAAVAEAAVPKIKQVLGTCP